MWAGLERGTVGLLVQHADHLAKQTPPTTLNAVNITFSKQITDEQHKYISEQSSRVIKKKRSFMAYLQV